MELFSTEELSVRAESLQHGDKAKGPDCGTAATRERADVEVSRSIGIPKAEGADITGY